MTIAMSSGRSSRLGMFPGGIAGGVLIGLLAVGKPCLAQQRIDWEDLGGVVTSSPTAASWGENRLDVFARGQNGHMWHLPWNGSSFLNWEDLGGDIIGAPAAVSWGPDRIDCFARGLNNHVWHKPWIKDHWNNWEDLGGVVTSAPAVASWGDNRLDVFARGQNGHMWHLAWDGSQFSGWEDLGGDIVGAPAAVSWGPNRIDCFAQGLNAHVWHKPLVLGQWNDWEDLGGEVSSELAVATWRADRLDIFARAPSGKIRHLGWDGTRWLNWENYSDAISSPPASVSWGPHRMDLFARGDNDHIWHKGTLPFDVVSRSTDGNGLPRNPIWGYQAAHGNEAMINYSMDAPGQQDNPENWWNGPRPFTRVHVVTRSGGVARCGPHVNFGSVAYQGNIAWASKSPPYGSNIDAGIGDDADCGCTMTRTDKSLFTSTSSEAILLEFNSNETLDHFATPWWVGFRAALQTASDGKNNEGMNPSAKQYFHKMSGTVIGMLGLDCAGGDADALGLNHHCGVELHPVFGMALDVDETPTANRWAFFMRNVGNEGYCSPGDNNEKERLVGASGPSGQIYKLVLPGPHPSEDFELDPHIWNATIGTLDNVRYWNGERSEPVAPDRCAAEYVQGVGVVLTFVLPPPDAQSSGQRVIEGQLDIAWKSRATPGNPQGSAHAATAAKPTKKAMKSHGH